MTSSDPSRRVTFSKLPNPETVVQMHSEPALNAILSRLRENPQVLATLQTYIRSSYYNETGTGARSYTGLELDILGRCLQEAVQEEVKERISTIKGGVEAYHRETGAHKVEKVTMHRAGIIPR